MSKKWIVVYALTLIAAIVFCCFWIYERNNKSDLEALCQYNAAQSLADFKNYESSSSDGDYQDAVGNFKAFLNTWLTLEEKSSAEYLWCNSVYGYMILQPEAVQKNIDKLITAMEIIGNDYTHPNGYLRMQELDNILKHG